MFAYVTLGTNDLERATMFYDALLAELGAKRVLETSTFVAWGTGMGAPSLAATLPFDGNPATVGNGVMVALAADSAEDVKKLHTRALQLGAADEGTPGPRGNGAFFAGYFRDLDGNKLNAFCML